MPEEVSLSIPTTSVWSRLGSTLTEQQFYAAVYLLYITQRQQDKDEREILKKESEKQVKIFLDRLALLCAHTKKRNTQKHVTTTGLVEDAGECSIYIAKNDGLRDTDLAFVKCLENWLNKRTDSGAEASEHDDTMWIRMVNFWQSRINYYAQEIEKLWKKIGDAEMETSRHFSGPDALYAFHKKWSMIRERVDLAAKLKGGQQDDGATEIFETFYFFFNRAPSLDISRGNEVRPYRKIVAAIEMLGMPQSMWNAFLAFREHPDWTNIRIVVIRKPELPSPKLDISGIMQVLMAWKWQKTRLGIDESLEELRKTNNPPELYFHCELQMLSILHGRANAHWYIGCSKLSCELCWLILRDGSYTTRGSHHKISANCAFHFPDDLEQGMTRLKEIHELFKGKIFRSPLDEWTKYANLLDTDPQHTGLAHTDNLVDEVSHRPFVVGYKLMNISRQQKNLLVYYSDQFPATRGRYGPYQIDANLEPSVGGFATVYKAIKCYDPSSSHPGRQNFFALKEIVIKDKGQCVDIAAEHAILHKIVPHRNLLRLVEAFYISDPRIVYFATKLWAPVSLHRFLEDVLEGHFRPWYKPNTLGQWPSILLQCLDGLEHLHNSYEPPITHNDLKPHNILLLAENEDEGYYVRPIITDFGLSGRSHTGNIKNIGTKNSCSLSKSKARGRR